MTESINKLAPIVIFAFNRPDKLELLINSLEKNEEYKNSTLIVYVDKYLEDFDKQNNLDIIYFLNSLNNTRLEIIYRSANFGLKNNIVSGINEIFEKYESAIFLEEDLEVGKYFLKFINDALNLYKDDKSIWHISGYNFPIFKNKSSSAYITTLMNCWGWATWSDRWKSDIIFDKNIISNKSKFERLKFTFFGFEKDFESQLKRNDSGELNTWAIYWYQHIFLKNGRCIQPKVSLVKNNGNDGSGIHKSSDRYNIYNLNNSQIKNFPSQFINSFFIFIKILKFYKIKNNLKFYKLLKNYLFGR